MLLQCKSFSQFFNENFGEFQLLTFEILTNRYLTTSLVLNDCPLGNIVARTGPKPKKKKQFSEIWGVAVGITAKKTMCSCVLLIRNKT